MRLLTHNQLTCAKKECGNAFPLAIAPTKVEQTPSDCNPQFIGHIIARVDYPALYAAAQSIGLRTLPPQLPEAFIKQSTVRVTDAKTSNVALAAAGGAAAAAGAGAKPAAAAAAAAASAPVAAMPPAEALALAKLLHTALLDTRVLSGALVCPKCKRLYPIEQGIPNMRLKDDEL